MGKVLNFAKKILSNPLVQMGLSLIPGAAPFVGALRMLGGAGGMMQGGSFLGNLAQNFLSNPNSTTSGSGASIFSSVMNQAGRENGSRGIADAYDLFRQNFRNDPNDAAVNNMRETIASADANSRRTAALAALNA